MERSRDYKHLLDKDGAYLYQRTEERDRISWARKAFLDSFKESGIFVWRSVCGTVSCGLELQSDGLDDDTAVRSRERSKNRKSREHSGGWWRFSPFVSLRLITGARLCNASALKMY